MMVLLEALMPREGPNAMNEPETARPGMATAGIAFGPVPSRRLGRSLGVNNVPPKHCSYSCVYCQVGRTTSLEARRRTFFPPEVVVSAVERRVADCRASGQEIDYVSFVPDGEPTLDIHLGEEIRALKRIGVPVAVITNGSLLSRPDVRADLGAADLVSVKVDALDEPAWRRVSRPCRSLDLSMLLDGVRRFATAYPGTLLTETMLVRGLNDRPPGLEKLARFIRDLGPAVAYLAVPTRPPAESSARAPGERAVVAAHEVLAAWLPRVELLTGDEGGGFGHTGDPAEDLLGILAVHPMQEAAARRYLAEAGAGPAAVDALLARRQVVRVSHAGRPFLALGSRRLRSARAAGGAATRT
jgi:wyosine [tRNA(Phe)-imidazoG37] synthetase (radical SAM superfamily)